MIISSAIHHQPLASTISGTISTGLTITGPAGQPARLAIIDAAGQVIEAGDDVARAVMKLAVASAEAIWQGQGHLTIYTTPPAAPGKTKRAA